VRRTRAAIQRGKQRFQNWRERRKADRKRRKEQRQSVARERTTAAINSMLSNGVSDTILRLQLLRLKIQYGWRRLYRQRSGDRSSFKILGGFSPEDELATGTIVLDVISATDPRLAEPVQPVTLPPPSRGFEGVGKRYQAVVNPYVEGPLATELFGRGGFQPTGLVGESRRRSRGLPSSLSTVRLHQEKGLRVGGRERFPDYRADVFGIDPATGRRSVEAQEFHAIEITVVTDFADRRPQGGAHKVDQFLATLELVQRRYPTARVTYTFVAPGQPSVATRQYINGVVNNMGLARRVRVVWRIVPIAP
jgi:hypothetical protein